MNKYKSSVLSITNTKVFNKPNEDFFLCDDNKKIYLMVDGVSRDKIGGLYPNPSPSATVSKIFIDSAYEYFQDNYLAVEDEKSLLFNMVCYGNKQIELYNKQKEWINNFLPGTVGIIGIIKKQKFFYVYIGDCYGLIISHEKKMFTKCQTQTIRNMICNNKNHPYSYGVLNGDLRALDFLEYGYQSLYDNEKIFLCSDGFYDALSRLSAPMLYSMTPEQIAEYSEDTDDKTLIIIEKDK